MTLEEMKQRRRELGYTYRRLSELSGVPVGTIQKIFGGMTASPRYETLLALEKVLLGQPKNQEVRTRPGTYSGMVSEEALTGWGKKQGEFTVEDLEKLPEDKRYELIDGILFDMSDGPTYGHQVVAMEILFQCREFIRRNGGKCRTMTAPFSVHLDRDNRTSVQPDVMILCRDEDLNYHNYQGAPDFVVEVLSPSTRRKDMTLKLRKYEAAGVREYWMIDVEKEKVIVHVYGEEPDVWIYGFDQPIPVWIFGGELKVDLRPIREDLEEIRKRGNGNVDQGN